MPAIASTSLLIGVPESNFVFAGIVNPLVILFQVKQELPYFVVG